MSNAGQMVPKTNILANKYHFDDYLQKGPVPVFYADSLSDIKLWRVDT